MSVYMCCVVACLSFSEGRLLLSRFMVLSTQQLPPVADHCCAQDHTTLYFKNPLKCHCTVTVPAAWNSRG